jgi:hypothetical protein
MEIAIDVKVGLGLVENARLRGLVAGAAVDKHLFPRNIGPAVATGWVLRVLKFFEQILGREAAGSKAGNLHGALNSAKDRLEFTEISLVLLPSPLNRLLLADSKATKFPILLCRVIEPGVDSGIPDEVDMEPGLEIVTTLLLLPPHSQPMSVQSHDLSDLRALLIDIAIEQIAEVFRDLIPELNTHAHVRYTPEQSFKLRLRIVAVAVVSEVRQNSLEFVPSDEGSIGTDHNAVAVR